MTSDQDPGFTRRGLFRRSVAGAVGLYAGSAAEPTVAEPQAGGADGHYAANQPGSGFDLTNKSGALQPDKIVDSACQFCNSLCRLKVHIKAGRVIDILGEEADPVQAGGLCVKGPMMRELVYNAHRLRTPLRRVSGEKGSPDSKFETVSWDEALRAIARKLLALRDAGDARSIANKTSGRLPRGTGSLVGRFFTLLGSPNDTDVGPVCNDAGGNALAATFGMGNFTNGYGVDPSTGKEDLGAAQFFLLLGTNQAETHPVTFAYLLRSKQKTGAKMVVVDPRLTPTGAQADKWISLRPHTDMALVLAMLHHIVTSALYDKPYIEKWVIGFDELKAHLLQRNYTPQWAEEVTGIPAADIAQLAHDYATAKPAAIFCNAGISHQVGAFDTYRAIAMLASITGNVGVPGGGCNFMHNTWPGDLHLPPLAVKTPDKDVALPVGPDYFAESILTGNPYPLKALLTCGNPLLGSANTQKVAEAFKKLEFYVYTGLFMEESAYYADFILPACSGLEMETVYMRRDDRAIRWQDQATPRIGESKPDWEIWIDLAHAMGAEDKKNPASYWSEAFPTAWRDYKNLWAEFSTRTPGVAGMTQQRLAARAEPLRWPCPSTDHPGVSTLYLDHPSWYTAAESLDPKNRGKRFLTASGKIELFTHELDTKLASAGHSALPIFFTHPETTGSHPVIHYSSKLVPNPVNPQAFTPLVSIAAKQDADAHRDFPLVGMSGRASVVHFAGMTQWTQTGKLMNGIRLIQIHPSAAKAAQIVDGDQVIVESPRGSIRGTALLWEGIRADTIFVPNTFGPMQKVASEVGTPLYESTNALTDDRYYDNLSGQQAYKCFACRVRKD